MPARTTLTAAEGLGRSVADLCDLSRKFRELVHNCIVRHIDPDALGVLEVAEQSEREILQRLASIRPGPDGDVGDIHAGT